MTPVRVVVYDKCAGYPWERHVVATTLEEVREDHPGAQVGDKYITRLDMLGVETIECVVPA